MLISLCIPVHNRTYDLKITMPHLLMAANASPPVEIVVVDYNSQDDLRSYIKSVMNGFFEQDVSLTYRRYTGREHYHMAHARNLSVKASSGEYIVILSADIYLDEKFLPWVREEIEAGYVWLYDEIYKGVIACRREEFIEAGGYDERIEFYGPEDRELHARLERRGKPMKEIPGGMVHVIQTPDSEKVKGYRLEMDKREMHKLGKVVLEENNATGILVANAGQEWGQWT